MIASGTAEAVELACFQSNYWTHVRCRVRYSWKSRYSTLFRPETQCELNALSWNLHEFGQAEKLASHIHRRQLQTLWANGKRWQRTWGLESAPHEGRLPSWKLPFELLTLTATSDWGHWRWRLAASTRGVAHEVMKGYVEASSYTTHPLHI